jgi:hypothetical protein
MPSQWLRMSWTARAAFFVGSALATMALALTIASSSSALMLGVNWRNPETSELDTVQRSGASVYHMAFDYSNSSGGNWSFYDNVVEAAWQKGVTILPGLVRSGETGNRFLLQSDPGWVKWGNWAREAVERYGVNGSFWNGKSNPKPITAWEVWNEPNLVENNPKISKPECQIIGQVYFEKDGTCIQPQNYGKFLKYTAEAIQAGSFTKTAHGTEVLFGGLYVPAGESYSSFLTKAYAVSGVPGAFTGLALHPYSFVTGFAGMTEAITGARGKLNSLGAGGKSLWLTEFGWPTAGSAGFPAGGHPVSEAEQAELLTQSFNWIKANAGANNIQLAAWFNIRDYNSGTHWDGSCGLQRNNGSYRPAWHAFQDQTGAPAPPVLGMLTNSGVFNAKQGSLGTEWLQQSEGIKAIAVASDPTNGPLVVELSNSGVVYAKQGSLGAEWVQISEGIKAIAAASDPVNGPLIGVLTNSGVFFAKQGGLGAEWVQESEGIKAIAVASDPVHGPLLGELSNSGVFFAKQGSLGAEWVQESEGIQSIAVATDRANGPLIAELSNSGVFLAKQGSLGAEWVKESEGIKAIAVASDPVHGPLIAELSNSGVFLAKQGSLGAEWVKESEGIKAIAVSSDRTNGALLGELSNSGVFLAKQGSLGGEWIQESPAAKSFALAG